jgi:succinoglycan biosynthesis transport protein ExoP
VSYVKRCRGSHNSHALDTTLKTGDEVREIYEAPVLANILTEKSNKNQTRQVALTKNPVGPGAEAYRVLRNNLGFINFGHDIKTVLITSAAPDEGKSTVAANLAIALSSAGKKVALVICDFHLPAADICCTYGSARCTDM